MTDPVHHLNRSERRLGRMIQALLTLGILLVLVDDVLDRGQVEPEASVETATLADAAVQADQTDRDPPPTATEPTLPKIEATSTTIPVRTFTLVATGDIISHGAVAERADANVDDGWDYSEMFRRVRPILTGADLALCHLESPLSMDDDDLSFSGTFRVPSSLADAVAGAGYDGCSLASNHALDSGRSSVDATLHHLRRVGLGTAGMADSADATGPAWYQPGGIRVAHLSYTDLMNSRDLPADPPWLVGYLAPAGVEADAAAAVADGAEFVVVSLHWGEEYRVQPTDRQAVLVDRLLAMPDVDLVLGHHAHVLQPVVRRDGKVAVIGLGNFLTNQPGDDENPCGPCPPSTQDGMIAWFAVADGIDGPSVVDAGYVPTWVDRDHAYEVVPIGIDDPEQVDPALLAESAARTAAVVEPELRRLEFTAG
jgi:poly-gamma-glutamate synthesis protein (capsule biosynthesis protein)|tara:strand:+ start:2666 stop:3943 length:1278 start_codon:yes stop_codon:yes gene_type:complete